MATSSITHNFVISGKKNVERFLNAIEESYQESLHREPVTDLDYEDLEGDEFINFMLERKRMYEGESNNS